MTINPHGLNVYISGPVTNIDRDEAIRAFRKAAETIAYWGGESFIPTDAVNKNASHEEAVLLCLGELTLTHWDVYEDEGLKATTRKPFYDLMVQLDGWEDSAGCRAEAVVAAAVGIERCSVHDLEDPDE